MKVLFALVAVLILLFSMGLSGYLAFFKIPLKNEIAKIFTFMLVSLVSTAITFIICLAIIWPPVRM
ncbi:MAG: hypothetical protein RO469_12335 [Thermincola sp.]|jgi:hypothetical protein|nr:hypothetical protein [Thermincola sp.]MDT3701929.1 hypothetical protein [Thermincola sp.]